MFSARLKDWEERNTKEKRSTKNESVTGSLQSFDVRTAWYWYVVSGVAAANHPTEDGGTIATAKYQGEKFLGKIHVSQIQLKQNTHCLRFN